MPRKLRQSGRGGRGRGDPPAYTRPIGNPYKEPTFRAQLQRAILQEHERITGETPWNNNRRNVLRAVTDTGVTVTPEWPQQVNLAHDEHPRTPTLPPAQVDNRAEHRQNLLDGVANMRTKLLDCFFFLIYILLLLHFLTYIHFLCTL